ncbi:neuronal acetylcholine receptor subunit alpha-9-like [Mercenaria mercenaria]|uniref:neuronal acetylcholine receptor subunit alpha-9-like n=1 Tax=Mercenaria mercenaria TaxID=6596 RepID=UPI00234E90C9|nr:neuronal acetylcholine receptor subunit alpha-9-like [Mercenaria mercenaria]
MWYLLLASIFVLFSTVHNAEAYTPNDTATLQADLYASYAKKFRPRSKTDVLLEFGLLHITELDIVTQRLHCVGFLLMDWNDDRLQWTPSQYGNMTFTMTLLPDLWTPPLTLSNAADEIKLLNDNSNFASSPVFVQHDGAVVWMAPANFIAQCTINIKYYPFDSQNCKIVVTSWMYLENQIDLGATFSKINLDIYEEHGEWEITQTSVNNITRVLSGYRLPAIQFSIHLKRKYSYYLLNMLLPVVILAVMAPFVFILPVESGEKIGYALTILLSLSVVMTLVSDSIPPTSTNICVLSVYLLTTFIICSLVTLVTVITCRVHELHNKTYLMGERCQKLARVLAKITRYRRRPKIGDLNELKEDHSQKIIQVKMAEKIGLSEQPEGDNNNAWTENENEEKYSEIEVKIEFTYEDMVIMCETLNFIAFTILTSSVTIIVMVILQTGESV